MEPEIRKEADANRFLGFTSPFISPVFIFLLTSTSVLNQRAK